LEIEGKKEVKKYADERLKLQNLKKEEEKAWNSGLEGKTLKIIEEEEKEDIDTEKGVNPIHDKDRG